MTAAPKRPERVYFGGKGPSKYEWTPLPWMEQYLTHLAESKSEDYSKVASYGLIHFARFCEQEDVRHPTEIERKHLHRFERYLEGVISFKGKPLSMTTRISTLRYARSWVTWLFREGHIDSDPWILLKIASPPKRKRQPLHNEELIRVFEAHKQHAFVVTPFFYHRREVILALLVGWGLRLSELTSLTVTAMDMRLNEVMVRRAGGDMKKMPYSDEMKAIIQRWLRVRGARSRRGEDALLIDRDGYPLSEAMIANILKELGSKAGVALTPKRFRETYGKTLANAIETEVLMKMLGITTKQYARSYSADYDAKTMEAQKLVIDPLLGEFLGGKA